MAILSLKIIPDQASYSLDFGEEFLAVEMEGGPAYYRQDQLGASVHLPGVTWTTDEAGWEYLRAFYQLTGAKGLPFAVQLFVNDATLVYHEAHFQKIGLVSTDGPIFVVRANLEVTPLPIADADAQAIVDAYVSGSAAPAGSGGVLDGVLS